MRIRDVIDEKGNRRGDVVIEQPPPVRSKQSTSDMPVNDNDSEVQFNVKSSVGRAKTAPDPNQGDTATNTNLGARPKTKSTATASVDAGSDITLVNQTSKSVTSDVTAILLRGLITWR